MLLNFFFFNDTATTEIYTLSLHDALPIYQGRLLVANPGLGLVWVLNHRAEPRSEEHTSELQSRLHLVCRLLLEKKKQTDTVPSHTLIAAAVHCPPDAATTDLTRMSLSYTS